jgi:predicted Fe-S protein YdhL (DUF1289 family)
MIKTGDEKKLSDALIEKQKSKGTYDSPCMSVCNYIGLFNECQTCSMRKVEKSLWKTGDDDMKGSILRSMNGRTSKKTDS